MTKRSELADSTKARAISAGTQPALRIHPEVVTAMQEIGIDLSNAGTQRLTDDNAQQAQWLITMGCGDECPFVPGVKRDDWALDDPKGSLSKTCAASAMRFAVASRA